MTPSPGTDERWSAAAIAQDVRGGRRSAAEVVDEALDRIAGANGALNAFCEVRPRAARAAAAALDARIAAGEDVDPALPLAGVPVAVKDVIWEAGVEATDGSRSLLGFVPQEDAIVVERLVAAGAIVVGRVNAPEFCYRGICANDLYGVTSNPWDLGRTPGGSSGGSAAAVAAGLVPLAIGTDGGGSIRIPSSFCGVAGFKPTYRRRPARAAMAGLADPDSRGTDRVHRRGLCADAVGDRRARPARPDVAAAATPRFRTRPPSGSRRSPGAAGRLLGGSRIRAGRRRGSPGVQCRDRALRVARRGARGRPPGPLLPNPVDIWNTLTTTDNLASEGPLLETGRVGA